jgi:hypothetical protein
VIVDLELGGDNRIHPDSPKAGGSAFNAALAFKQEGFDPIVFGAVGDDPAGDTILTELEYHGIGQLITRDQDRPTGRCNILHFRYHDGLRTTYYDADNANSYDVKLLRRAIERADLGSGDYLFAPLHILEQKDRRVAACRPFMNALSAAPGRLIVDLVPHRLYDFCDANFLRGLLPDDTWLMIGEFETFFRLIHLAGEPAPAAPTQRDRETIATNFRSENFACRYGAAGIGYEILFGHELPGHATEAAAQATGYARLRPDQARGFGDLLTTRAVRALARSAMPTSPVQEMEMPA